MKLVGKNLGELKALLDGKESRGDFSEDASEANIKAEMAQVRAEYKKAKESGDSKKAKELSDKLEDLGEHLSYEKTDSWRGDAKEEVTIQKESGKSNFPFYIVSSNGGMLSGSPTFKTFEDAEKWVRQKSNIELKSAKNYGDSLVPYRLNADQQEHFETRKNAWRGDGKKEERLADFKHTIGEILYSGNASAHSLEQAYGMAYGKTPNKQELIKKLKEIGVNINDRRLVYALSNV